MKKITIVTVCLNVEDSIEDTMQSVLKQKNTDYEYVIQDGGSTDRTLEIIKAYQQKYPQIQLYSEKDTGLYNAMNRAIEHATGEYILFLNSMDVLCDNQVLGRIIPKLGADIVMGNVIRVREEGEVVEKYAGKNKVFWMLLSGKMPCHQIIFAKRSVLLELHGFQERFTITADFDFMVRSCKRNYSMEYVDIDVSRVDCIEGISSQAANLEKMREQDDQSLKENYPGWYIVMKPIKWMKRKWLG